MKKVAAGTCHSHAYCTRGQNRGSSSPSKVGARCVSSARRDLCGGRREISVPTATSSTRHVSAMEVGAVKAP